MVEPIASLRRMAAAVATTTLSDATPPPCLSPPDEYSLRILRLCASDHLPHIHSALALPSAVHPSAFAALFHACARRRLLFLGRCLHRCMLSLLPWPPDLFVANHLLNMYAKCGRLDLARRVFKEMPRRNLVSWTALLSGFAQHGHHDDCFGLLAGMLPHHLPNEFALATALSSCAGAARGFRGRQVHALASKIYLDANVFVGNALITMYSSCYGQCDDSWAVFRTMPFQNLVTWNSMIAGFRQNGQLDRSLELFVEMQRGGLGFDRATLVSVISSCSCLQHCRQLHSPVIKTCYDYEVEVATALVKAYSIVGGSTDDCYGVFGGVREHDIVSWTGIMTSFAEQLPEEAIRLFCQLRYKNYSPDRYTFSIVVKACSGFATERHCSAVHSLIENHSGLVNEGRDLFNSMLKAYGIAPQLDHFACMVDILGRAGNLQEAEDLINQMEVEPDFVVWSALLGACRKHKEARIAEKAAQRLMELKPKNSIGYVMMSNIHYDRGNLEDASFIRKDMKECGVKKEPGLSWIEIENHIHRFSVGARHHPLRKAIYAELNRLVDSLKEIGYVVHTRLVHHETQEHKEERLLHHSEKLALAFALMNTSASKTNLKIMKNLRICEDCHKFFKLASSYLQKEIIVRDANRFHHFVDGECSCVQHDIIAGLPNSGGDAQTLAAYHELMPQEYINTPRSAIGLASWKRRRRALQPPLLTVLERLVTTVGSETFSLPLVEPFIPSNILFSEAGRWSSEASDHVECSGNSCRSCTAVLVANCIALGCCPCAVVNMLTLTLVKVPWMVSRRWWQSLRRTGASQRRRVADAATVGREGTSSEMKRNYKWNEEGAVGERKGHSGRGSLPSSLGANDGVWEELYRVGNWGFGRVSFSGTQREWHSGKNTSGDDELGEQR
ncbi:unnamed protein product [Musa hybrid cultivar]